MTQVLLNTSGSGTWTVPSPLAAGQTVTVEGWGGGGGGGARSSGSAFGSGGGGGGYISSTYTLTPNDITNGIPYVVAAGAAGGTGGDGGSGSASTWSNNNVNMLSNSICGGAAPGVLPTNWTSTGTPTGTVVDTGIDPTLGIPYVDIEWNGTTASTHSSFGFDTFLVSAGSTAYCGSIYCWVVGGATTNFSSIQLIVFDWTAADAFVGTPQTTTMSLTSSPTRFSGTGTTASSGLRVTIGLQLNFTAGKAVNLTLRIAGPQIEPGTTPSAWKSTPGYLSATGGARSNGASGGNGGSASIGTGTAYTGGAGAAYNVAGAGGGGSAGPDGAGNAGTTSGVGGQGDATTGGAGGAVSATNPGNAGTANTSGGGGGGSLTTVGQPGDVAGAGGAPGGGGGGAVFYSGLGPSTAGAGAIGQIRITYSGSVNNLLSLAATSAESFGLATRVAHDFLAGVSSPQALTMHRMLATSFVGHAMSSQSVAYSRILSALRSLHVASSQAAAYSGRLALLRSYGTTDTESTGVIARRAKLQVAAATSGQMARVQRFIGHLAHAASAQSMQIVRGISCGFTASDGQSAHVSKQSARSFAVSSGYLAAVIHRIGVIRGVLQAYVAGVSIPRGGLNLNETQGQIANMTQTRSLAPFIVLSSAAQAVTTWFHTFVPLALRRRVVRLPPPMDISTLPPSARIVVLPREEDEMLDSSIFQPEPALFSPFDPTDQDTFTFDWSRRAYPNDVITAASIAPNPTGPIIIGGPVVNGLKVSATLGPFSPPSKPATYALRCSVAFASGRVGNYSIPFRVEDL